MLGGSSTRERYDSGQETERPKRDPPVPRRTERTQPRKPSAKSWRSVQRALRVGRWHLTQGETEGVLTSESGVLVKGGDGLGRSL